MMQVIIDTHPQWFSTAAERADLPSALCFILGMTSWTGLCRLLRGETLAAGTGIHPGRPGLRRHQFPHHRPPYPAQPHAHRDHRPGHGFFRPGPGGGRSSLRRHRVDPTMISFGTMINNARMELGREPAVWWSLAAAFIAMFTWSRPPTCSPTRCATLSIRGRHERALLRSATCAWLRRRRPHADGGGRRILCRRAGRNVRAPGESGCGKSVTAQGILRLLPAAGASSAAACGWPARNCWRCRRPPCGAMRGGAWR